MTSTALQALKAATQDTEQGFFIFVEVLAIIFFSMSWG
jgi:hypothetical protein